MDDKLEVLQKALDRLIRFNRALIQMGAVETPQALDQELRIAFEALSYTKHG